MVEIALHHTPANNSIVLNGGEGRQVPPHPNKTVSFLFMFNLLHPEEMAVAKEKGTQEKGGLYKKAGSRFLLTSLWSRGVLSSSCCSACS